MLRRSMVSMLASDSHHNQLLSLLQTSEGGMLLPDVAVAEVVGWQRDVGETYTWCDQVLSCLNLSGEQKRVCIVICNVIYRPDSKFFALAVQQLPKMLRITESDIEDVDANLVYPWQRSWVNVVNNPDSGTFENNRFILPDIEQLEEHLA